MTLDEARRHTEIDKCTILVDKEFSKENEYEIDKEIINKLKDKGVSRDILITLYHCISEATDNTLDHGKVDSGHIAVGINKTSINILIFDEGKGIYENLKPKYPDSSIEEVLNEALSKSISSDNGCGNGLYAWNLLAENLATYFEMITNNIIYVPCDDDFSYLMQP